MKKTYVTSIILLSGLFFISIGLFHCEKTTTISEDQDPPVITTNPEVQAVTDSSVDIYWETDEPANAKVNYRAGSEDWLSVTDDEYRMKHTVAITGLSPNSEYSYYVESVDFFGNGPTSSSVSSFKTHHNAESLTLIGWDFFESAEYDSATHYFLSAVDYNSSFPEGYVGLGWTYNYTDQLFEAVSVFTDALTLRDSLKDALAGRAAGYISLNDYDSSIEDAEKLLGIDSLYVFEHDTSVNYLDVHLMAAESYFHIGDYENAQIHVDFVDPDNGLSSTDSTTWVVDGVQYEDYIEALLSLIQKLVGIFGG